MTLLLDETMVYNPYITAWLFITDTRVTQSELKDLPELCNQLLPHRIDRGTFNDKQPHESKNKLMTL